MSSTSISKLQTGRTGSSGLRTAWKLLVQTAEEWWSDNTFRFAAALAFYTLFSLGPMALMSVGIASFFFMPALAIENVVMRVQDLVGTEGANAVRQVISTSGEMGKSPWAIIVGGVTFFLGASVVFGELQAALNAIWDVRADAREGMLFKVLANRLRSFGIALAMGFLLAVSLVVGTMINSAEAFAIHRLPGMPWLWQSANVVVSFAVVILLFGIIYKYLPDVRLAWHDVWMGAAVTGVLFIAGKFAIGLYLNHAGLGGAFGSAGSLVVLLVWVYYSALISFFGAEFTFVYAKHRGRKIPLESHAVRAGRKTHTPSTA